MKQLLFIFIFISINGYSQNIEGHYEYKLTFEGTPIYRHFKLDLNADSTFTMSKYVFESDHDYEDTISGKWKVVNNNLSFYNIDQPKYITKSNTNHLFEKEIIINEKCVFSYMSNEQNSIKLLALDSDYNVIKYIAPKKYKYENETIETKFDIPKNSFQLIYYNGNAETLDHYFYGGINIVDFLDYNNYDISNCGMTNDMPIKFLTPFIQFQIEKDWTLKSLKKYREIDEKERNRIFKKSS